MRWELNDLARRLDGQPNAVELSEDRVPAPAGSDSGLTPAGLRMLEAIGDLPADEREAFGLVRIQGATHPEAAEVLGVSLRTVKRRVSRGLRLLTERLGDLCPEDPAPGSAGIGPGRSGSPAVEYSARPSTSPELIPDHGLDDRRRAVTIATYESRRISPPHCSTDRSGIARAVPNGPGSAPPPRSPPRTHPPSHPPEPPGPDSIRWRP